MAGSGLNGAAAAHGARYSSAQIALHWIVVAGIVSQWLTSGAIQRTHNPLLPPSSTDLLLHSLHNYGGITIGVLMVLRVLLRLLRPVPPADGLPAWQKRASAIVQWGLYASLFAQAGTGFTASYLWAGAAPIHGLLWNVTLTLAFLHIAAAIVHLCKGDGIFRRMVPATRQTLQPKGKRR
ncbi:cytochrome b [Nitratireductor sp. ZSWI3]|uniref:cytochrome b n=1 Tax=Nitratireductor sp. ZSWI3 TaxID=2966359 RepID=UPI00215039CE|nr:cytochrome b/b6 domain-containing protein [Nitratireductor sp. ZSWI3]MCR4267519.1 cytochrome b/b6 domain-containing protein [Nitratireductor sp. ZSWI3]